MLICHPHNPKYVTHLFADVTTTDESMTRQQAPGEIFVPFNLKYSKHCHDTVTHLMSPLPLVAFGILDKPGSSTDNVNIAFMVNDHN